MSRRISSLARRRHARHLSAGERLRDISLQVRSGEIVGVAGLVGSGRSRLCRALAGADTPSSGQLLLHGKPVRLRNPQQALRAGIALIPEDRKNQALSLAGSVRDNLTLMALRKGMGPLGITPASRVTRLATRYVEQLEVNPPDLDAPVGTKAQLPRVLRQPSRWTARSYCGRSRSSAQRPAPP